MKLRDYQAQAVECIHKAFEAHRRALVVMPTGTGKTVVFAHVIRDRMEMGRAMVIAHRRELLDQARNAIHKVCGVVADIEQADNYAQEQSWFKSPVVVSSVQTQISGGKAGRRMYRFEPGEFATLVVDEAHHAPAASYIATCEWYEKNEALRTLGVTATPDRLDKRALGMCYDTVAFNYEICDAIDDGWLVPIRQMFVCCEHLDFSHVHTVAGDLKGSELERELTYEKPLHEHVVGALDAVGDRKSIFFCAGVEHARRVCEIVNRYRPDLARCLFGNTPDKERIEIVRDFRENRFRWLINVGVATEGWDVPDVECIIVARPTKSRALYAQMIGRGTRPVTGILDDIPDAHMRRLNIEKSRKPYMTVVDLVGNAGRHRLVTTFDILGGKYDEEVLQLAVHNTKREPRVEIDPDVALQIAERQIMQRREENKRFDIKAGKWVTRKTEIDPFEALNVNRVKMSPADRARPVTPKQIKVLEQHGIKADGLCRREAHMLIDEIFRRKNKGLATHKQVRLLKRYGFNARLWTKREASRVIGVIAAHGWRKTKKVLKKARAKAPAAP